MAETPQTQERWLPGQNVSEAYLGTAAAIFDQLHEAHPEIAALTAFGSCARGEATYDPEKPSDFDAYLLVDVDKQPALQRFVVRHLRDRSQLFIGAVSDEIVGPFKKALNATMGFSVDHSIIVRPVSQAILADQVGLAIEAGRRFAEDAQMSTNTFFSSRNLRALFHLPVGGDLLPYQKIVLTRLQQEAETNELAAEAAWQMTRFRVIEFETPRGDDDSAFHPVRKFPASLQDAVDFYLDGAPRARL